MAILDTNTITNTITIISGQNLVAYQRIYQKSYKHASAMILLGGDRNSDGDVVVMVMMLKIIIRMMGDI